MSKVVKHPVYAVPGFDEVRAFAKVSKLDLRAAFDVLHAARNEKIELSVQNPLVHGWEPPIWRVCDALLGLDWIIPEWLGANYGARMRAALGFDAPVNLLLINGGNRAGKSEYMAKRLVQCMLEYERATVWAFHTDGDMSRQYQQPLVHKYLPPEYKGKAIMSATTYIAFKLKTGFSEGNFILPNLSMCDFRNYMQEKTKIEGGELGDPMLGRCIGFIADELIPEEWVETLVLRLATRAACGVVGFTPIQGYTDTVKAFQDGADVARESVGYLLPRDGGEPVEDETLRVEDVDEWLTGERE
jgi:hypothetical protein